MSKKAEECVKVVLRCRPMNGTEKEAGRKRIVEMNGETGAIRVTNPNVKEPPKEFTFDGAFDWNSRQCDLYDGTCKAIVNQVMEGFNGTVFAYGQTGTGKTWTMEGAAGDAELKGVIPRCFEHIFEEIGAIDEKEFLVRASYLEIYNEELRDLLKKDVKNRLELKEDPESGVYVKDLSSFVVKSVKEIDQVFIAGTKNRTVGATLMNADSSRSHSIFSIIIEQSGIVGGETQMAMGKLNLVDLAGSERQAKTGAAGTRLKEATKINLSLSALGNVIKALVDPKKGHVPYRDSKLTRLLQDSLGGNAKTVMIANMGPADYNFDETINTLRYANRAKSIKNKPKINEDPKDAMLREFQDEIAKLKQQIASGEGPGGTTVNVTVKKIGLDEAELAAEKEKIRAEIEGDAAKTDEEKSKLLKQQEEAHAKKMAELEEQKAIAARLEMLEGKLVVGGENLLDKVAKEEAAQKRLMAQLEEQKRQEQMLQARMSEQKELNLEKMDHYGSLEEEVRDLDQKLKGGLKQFRQQQQENADARGEFQREMDEMRENIKNLSYKFKFQQLVLAHYIPEAVLHKIESTAQYDPVREEWLVIRLNFAGNVLRARSPERYASTKEGAAALEMAAEAHRQQMMMANQGGGGYGMAGMGGADAMYEQMRMAGVAPSGSPQAPPTEDKYLSYAEMAFQEEGDRGGGGGGGPESPTDMDPAVPGASKPKDANTRAKATKAKLKAAVAASMMLHAGGDQDKDAKEKDKEKEKKRRKKEKKEKKEEEARASADGGVAAKAGRPARPGTAGRGRKQGGAAAAAGSEYPEARGSVEDPLRY